MNEEENDLQESLARIRAFEDWASDHYDPPSANPYLGLESGTDMEDRWNVINAYLAEHPADEDEPVTQTWLIEIGWTSVGNTWYARTIDFAVCWIRVDETLRLGGAIIKKNPTRGDVRRLCAALGIPLRS